MESSEPKCVNPNDIQYDVNLLRLGGLHIKKVRNVNINMKTREPHERHRPARSMVMGAPKVREE